MTQKDLFFDRGQFCQLASVILAGKDRNVNIDLPPPAIVKVVLEDVCNDCLPPQILRPYLLFSFDLQLVIVGFHLFNIFDLDESSNTMFVLNYIS